MKTILLFLLLIPIIGLSKNSDSTYIEIIKSELDSSLNKNQSSLIIHCINPEGNYTTPDKIILIKDTDTICFGKDSLPNYPLILDSGKYTLWVYAKWWGEDSKEIVLKSKHNTKVKVNFKPIAIIVPSPNYDYDKPVIYFYPKKKQKIEALLNFKGELTFTYPKYTDKWKFSALPNGDINYDGKTYRYLFWEGATSKPLVNIDYTKGFIVSSDSITDFFENTLTKIGFKSTEQQDFITYWVPRMLEHDKLFLHFIFTEQYDSIAELDVKPKPDNQIRIFVFWKGLSKNYQIKVEPQNIPTYSREGFTIVEWGGGRIR